MTNHLGDTAEKRKKLLLDDLILSEEQLREKTEQDNLSLK